MTIVSASGLTLDLLAEDIKARVKAGDRDLSRSENHYQSAGITLIEAKARVAAELPGTTWLLWSAEKLPDLTYRQQERLIALANNQPSQAEPVISDEANRAVDEIFRRAARDVAARAAQDMRADIGMSARQEPQSWRDNRNTRRQSIRSEARTIREAHGGRVHPPRRTPEHYALLSEYQAIGDRLGIDLLRSAIVVLRRMEANEA